MKKVLILGFLISFWSFYSLAQSESGEGQQTPNSRDPGTSSESYSSQTKKKTSQKKASSHYFKKGAESHLAAAEKRQKKNARKFKKEQKLMKKPQFSDPLYLGHKKKPKIRRKGKRKLCKECDLIH